MGSKFLTIPYLTGVRDRLLQMASSRIHQAYFYPDHDALTERLMRIVREAFAENRMAMFFLTKEHKEHLEGAMRGAGMDVDEALRDARLKLLDARKLREHLFDGETINKERFDAAFEKLLREAVESGRPITVCGEVVSLLWQESAFEGALQLEKLWDEMLQKYNLHLYCIYATPANETQQARASSLRPYHRTSVA